MSEPPIDQDATYPWLTLDDVAAWLKAENETEGAQRDAITWSRDAAADYCQRRRPDLWATPEDGGDRVYAATHPVRMAGLIGAARLYARWGNAAGLTAYAEMGSALLQLDPDVTLLLGRHIVVG